MLKHMPSGNHTPCSLLSHSYVCGFYLQNQNGNITGKGVGKMQFLGFQLLQLKGELRRVRLILNINRLYLAHYQSSSPTPQRFYPSTNTVLAHIVNSPWVISPIRIFLVICRSLFHRFLLESHLSTTPLKLFIWFPHKGHKLSSFENEIFIVAPEPALLPDSVSLNI